jgi:hypothetical protein
MKIGVCAPVAERGWVLQAWINHIHWQDIRSEAEVRIFALTSPSNDDTEQILEDNNVEVIYRVKETRPKDEIDGHVWHPKSYFYMAQLRNCLVSRVRNYQSNGERWDPDYIFSLDTDILMPRRTISTLLSTMQRVGANAISPLVNLERHPNLPPAWNFMMWDDKGLADRLPFRIPWEKLPMVPFRADCLLAAILMDRKAQEILWGPSDQGEDITWSRNAEHRGIQRFVDPLIVCTHRMAP